MKETSTGVEDKTSMTMQRLIDDIKKTIVFLGERTGRRRPRFYATGFLVGIEDILHLITAKHVVVDPKSGKLNDGKMRVYFNLQSGGINFRPMAEIKRRLGVNWIFHQNKEVDIAIIPFPVDRQRDDVKVVPDALFLTSGRLFELYDTFFLSYQPGIEPQVRICPIFRSGTISIINEDKTFYIDAPAFPGNSGSPVFLKPSAIRFDKEGISIGRDELGGNFIGIIGEYIPYSELAISSQTGRPRIVFEENTGLSRVWSVDFIRDILQSDAFREQLDRLVRARESQYQTR